MNYVEQIFKMLGIEPMEEFRVKEMPFTIHRITKDFHTQFKRVDDTYWNDIYHDFHMFIAILKQELQIIKIPKLTAKDQIVIDYAKLCNCKWLAKDKNNMIHGFNNKPSKNLDSLYNWWESGDEDDCIDINYDASFLSWEDEEPYYIG